MFILVIQYILIPLIVDVCFHRVYQHSHLGRKFELFPSLFATSEASLPILQPLQLDPLEDCLFRLDLPEDRRGELIPRQTDAVGSKWGSK